MGKLVRVWGYSWGRRIILLAGSALVISLLFAGAWMSGFYSSDGFMPHQHCWLRDPGVTWLHVISDSLTGVAYVTISVTLGYLVCQARRGIPFEWIFLAFGCFIIFCGFTHFMAAVTVWHPLYWLAGDIKALTALASVATAVVLPKTVPKIVTLVDQARSSQVYKRDLEVAHQELRELYEKLRETDRLKSQFFANVSHELRTPLSLILGPVRRRLAKPDLPSEDRKELELVERNASLLHNQVNNLLDLAQLEAGEMKIDYARLDLAEMGRLVTSYFDGLAEEREITYQVEMPDSVAAAADAEKVQRVLLNFLSNAFKFTPENGVVRVSLESKGEEAIFVVEDSGPGIPPELREKVFERFMQVDGSATRKNGGSGLGLPIVREFVKLHGGSIALRESEVGGARFEVRLPLHAPEGEQVAEGSELMRSERVREALGKMRSYNEPAEDSDDRVGLTENGRRPLVLVVEDNPDMNDFLAQALQSDYRVMRAYNGQEGLDLARRLTPELIVTDIMMPRMSGDMMIREIQNEPVLRDVPVVILTASMDERNRIGLLKEGACDYLTKPFEVEDLRARIKGLIKRRREGRDRIEEAYSVMRAVIEGTDDPIYIKDSNGRYRMVNHAAAEMMDRSPATIEGATDRELFPSAKVDEVESLDRQVMAEGTSRLLEEAVTFPKGTVRTLLTRKGPYFDREGRVMGTFGIARDITDRRRAEDALRELNATLEQRVAERTLQLRQHADRLRIMTGQLASSEERERRRLAQALHDGLQQVLVTARMSVERARSQHQTGEDASQALGHAEEVLIESIKTSRSVSQELYPAVLYDAGLEAALEWLAGHFQQNYGLLVVVEAYEAAELGDLDLKGFLFQAVRELLMNVVKHAQANTATVAVNGDESMITVTVEDDGVGCEELADQESDLTQGGFGLFSLRERVRLLEGDLSVRTSPGRGTRVSLVCSIKSREPIHHKVAQTNAPEEGAGESKTFGSAPNVRPSESPRIRVMLVDDHRIVREGLAGILGAWEDIEVVAEAADGAEALEQIDAAFPDVVVMDVSMPRMDGLEATKWIVRNRPSVRVVVLSMYHEEDLANAMLQTGASAYVTKGGPSGELIDAIRRAYSTLINDK